MNVVDGVLIALLITAVVIGAKKGLVRELSALILFLAAGISAIAYIDKFAVWVYDKVGGSPLISAFIAFILLLAICYTIFKLLGMLFYKVASLKNQGKPDQIGGALVGFLRGWLAVGFLVFFVFLLPMPERFYAEFEKSYIGPVIAKTVPLVFEGTSIVHPSSPSFMDKIESMLLAEPSANSSGTREMDEDRAEVYRVMYQLDKFFNPGTTSGKAKS
ncbi:MAG: CvpA family protein [candidate division Zixibacteria bacterium]|nr:CvpA family protein [candidate division Zixibacteria bacterium]